MQTVGLISLGCPKNLVDSEIMLGLLEKAGYMIVQNPAEADVLIVNTCGFIDDAKKEAIDTILEMAELKVRSSKCLSSKLKKGGRCKKLVVTGCLPQRYKSELVKLLPEVDLFVGTGEYNQIVELLRSKDLSAHALKHLSTPQYIHNSATPRKIATPKHAVYVKIAEGCFHGCSFCIIPKLRGGFRSRPIKDIAAEVKMLVGNGARELNLIAQDTTSYGKDLNTNLVRLLEELSLIDGIFWIRIMYAYPTSITDEAIDAIANLPKVCKYLDIPIQHINDKILSAMRRKEKGRDIRLLIEKLRKRISGITLRTSLIVGFPGETGKEFNELASFVADGHFDHLGVFTYSREEGTSAARLKKEIPAATKEKRRAKIMEIQAVASKSLNNKWLGKTIKVLTDGKNFGRCEGQAPEIDGLTYIKAPGKVLKVGEFAEVKINGAGKYDLRGVLICSCPNTTT
ncbi:MAG: ribosomal protein S12 methylthiotransferase RimO [Deltaproteobacteria bacterium RIFCSPLOWO2_02_FULL_47_10]|nr:MAG: ribosomal protein S12 methylthiotransferase RimO [Deltaproteobacteria bacterium RIFCSPLOWO2_02_FULL_47_10]